MKPENITLYIKKMMRAQVLSQVMAFHGARIFVVGLLVTSGVGIAVFFFFAAQLTGSQYDIDASLKTINEGRLEKALLHVPELEREISLPPLSPF